MNKSHALADVAGTTLLSAGMLWLHWRNAENRPRCRGARNLSAAGTSNCYGSQIDPASIVRGGVEAVVNGAALAFVAWTAYELGKRSRAVDGSTRLRLCKVSLN